jgi:hypothetical protein
MQYTTPSPSQAPMTRDQMLADYRSKALRGAQDQTALTGLNEKYNRYTAQRDRAVPVPQTGRLGFGAVLSNLVGSGMAKNELEQLEPQRAAAMGRVNEAKTALPLYQASVSNANANQQQSNFEGTAAATLSAAKVKRKQELFDQANTDARYANEQGQVATAPVEYEDKQGNRVLLSRLKNGKWINGEGKELDSIKGLSEVAKVNKNINLGGGYDDATANKAALDDIKNLGAANRVIGLYNDLSPETIARISSPQKRIGDIIVKGIFPNNVASFIKSEIEKDPQVEQYYSDLSKMSAVERHAMFGGALTKFEAMSSNDFLSFVIGLPPEEQISRVQNSVARSKNSLDVADKFYNGTSFNDVLSSMEYNNLNFEAATPQEGSVNANRNATSPLKIPAPANIDAAEWSSYSREAQERYLESKGGTPK